MLNLRIDPADPLFVSRLPIAPAPTEHVAALRQRIDELSRKRAIDEGVPHVLDGRIAGIAEIRRRRIRQEHLERRELATREAAQLAAAVETRQERISELEAEIGRVQEDLDQALADLRRGRGRGRRRWADRGE